MNKRTEDKKLKSLDAHMRKALKEGQGVWELKIYDSACIPEMMIRSVLDGDPEAQNVAKIVTYVASAVIDPKQELLCLTCDFEFNDMVHFPAALLLLKGHNASARHAMVNVLCEKCVARSDMKQRVLDTIRNGLIPDMREINIRQGGNA